MRKYLSISLILILTLVLTTSLAACQKKAAPAQAPAEISIFSSGNIYGVSSQPSNPTSFTIKESYKITYISDYHYLNHGILPGTIALKDQNGTLYGPWQADGVPGQGNVPNASWIVKPNQVIKPGTYTLVDSDPATWSQNNQSGNRGFSDVRGYPSK